MDFKTLLSSWFRPLRDKVSSFNIEKSCLSFNRSFKVAFLTFSVSVSCSVKVNFVSWIKLSPFLKWTQTGIAFALLMYFQWLLNLMLKLVSDLSTHWIFHRIHSSKYIIHWLLHVVIWYMLKTLFLFGYFWIYKYLLLVYNIKLILFYYMSSIYLVVFLISS